MLNPKINPKLKIAWQKPFLIIDDFLENIDEFREKLKSHKSFSHAKVNSEVPNVGPAHDWRQVFKAEDFPKEFCLKISELQKQSTSHNTRYSTNRLFSDMKIETSKARASYYPHSDFRNESADKMPIVFNLWLHDGLGGTGFYTYDGYYCKSTMPVELQHFSENYIDTQKEAFNKNSSFQDYNSEFLGNDEWKLWYVAEMKKNRAFVYCGDLWHRVLIPNGEFLYPNERYSFVAFSAADPEPFLKESGSYQYLQNQTCVDSL